MKCEPEPVSWWAILPKATMRNMCFKRASKPHPNRKKAVLLEATVINDGGGKQGGASISEYKTRGRGRGGGEIILEATPPHRYSGMATIHATGLPPSLLPQKARPPWDWCLFWSIHVVAVFVEAIWPPPRTCARSCYGWWSLYRAPAGGAHHIQRRARLACTYWALPLRSAARLGRLCVTRHGRLRVEASKGICFSTARATAGAGWLRQLCARPPLVPPRACCATSGP